MPSVSCMFVSPGACTQQRAKTDEYMFVEFKRVALFSLCGVYPEPNRVLWSQSWFVDFSWPACGLPASHKIQYGVDVERMGWSCAAWVHIWPLLFPGWLPLTKLLNLSELQFSDPYNVGNRSTYPLLFHMFPIPWVKWKNTNYGKVIRF